MTNSPQQKSNDKPDHRDPHKPASNQPGQDTPRTKVPNPSTNRHEVGAQITQQDSPPPSHGQGPDTGSTPDNFIQDKSNIKYAYLGPKKT